MTEPLEIEIETPRRELLLPHMCLIAVVNQKESSWFSSSSTSNLFFLGMRRMGDDINSGDVLPAETPGDDVCGPVAVEPSVAVPFG